MKLRLCFFAVAILTGCVSPVKVTHTAAIAAPSLAPIHASIAKAQTANSAASVDSKNIRSDVQKANDAFSTIERVGTSLINLLSGKK